MTRIKGLTYARRLCGIDKKGSKTGQENVLDRLQNDS